MIASISGMIQRCARWKLPPFLVFLALSAAVIACYFITVRAPFQFDDLHSIQENVVVHQLSDLSRFWTDSTTSSIIASNRNYRPLTFSLHALCWWMADGQTWPFHAAKMLLHVLFCFAVFLLWRRFWKRMPIISGGPRYLNDKPSWFAFLLALFLAIHPAFSESVIYISATSSLLCAVLYLWALEFYFQYREIGQRGTLVFSILFYAGACLSKEEGITLPALIFFIEWFFSNGTQSIRTAAQKSAPHIWAGVLLGLLIFSMNPVENQQSRLATTSLSYFMTQWSSWLWYMRLWFVPMPLDVDPVRFEFAKSFFEFKVWASLLAHVALVGTAWWQRKKRPWLFFGLGWFYIAISPASSVVVLAETLNEHRMLLAFVGFSGAMWSLIAEFFWSLSLLNSRVPVRVVGLAAYGFALFVLSGLTMERNTVWLSAESLWTDTLEKNPNSGRAMNNVALVHMERGQWAEALALLSKCQQVWPKYAVCPLNEGIVREAQNNFKGAEESFLKAHSLNPELLEANVRLGRVYHGLKKDSVTALPYLAKADQISAGRHYEVNWRLGEILREQNRKVGAERLYERAIELNPSGIEAWMGIGQVELSRAQWEKAVGAFQMALQIDPNRTIALEAIAFASEKIGKKDWAAHALRRLAEIFPDNEKYRRRLSNLVKQ